MKFLIIGLLVLPTIANYGQAPFVEKIRNKNGCFLAIAIKKKDTVKRFAANCGFKEVTTLPESEKISLIGSLISYLTDTSISAIPVFLLSNYYLGKKYPSSKRYNIQIDALILINYVALSSYAFSYSPFPVLYDSQTNREVTFSSEALDSVIAGYKEWYNKIRNEGFANYGLPLWGGRYQWFGSIMGNVTFMKYPKWEDYHSCKTIE